MICVVEGYFKCFNKKNNIILVNLSKQSRKKLNNIQISLNMVHDSYSPILPNGLKISHDTSTICHDVDHKPCSTPEMVGQLIKVRCKVKKFKFYSSGDFVKGFNLYAKAIEIR
jgi:hypothetical protein